MAGFEAVLNLSASTLEATREVAKFQKSAAKSLGGIESSFGSLKKLAVAAVGVFASAKIVGFLEDCVDASAESQVAFNKLTTAMQLAGQYSSGAAQEMADYAKQIQATTTFEDDAVIAAQAHIETLARLDKDGLKKATQATVDLAAAMGIDLSSASDLVAKAANGNTAALGRMGIQVQKGSTNAQTLANVLKSLNDRFGGAAAAQVNTYSGAIAQAQNVFGGFKEEIGAVVTENATVVESIKTFSGFFQMLGDAVSANKDTISQWLSKGLVAVSKIIPVVLDGLSLLTKGLGYVTEAVVTVVRLWVTFLRVLSETTVVRSTINALASAIGTMASYVLKAIGTVVELASKIPGASAAFAAMGVDVELLGQTIQIAGDELKTFSNEADFGQGVTSGLQAYESVLVDVAATSSKVGEAMGGAMQSAADFARDASANLENANAQEKKSIQLKATTVKAIEDEKDALERIEEIKNEAIKAERDLRKEMEKRGATGRQVAEIELDGAQEAADRWAEELVTWGMAADKAEEMVAAYRAAAEAKAQLAKQDLGFAGIAMGDMGNIGTALSDASKGFVDNLQNGLKTLTLGDIAAGIGSAIKGAGEWFSGFISGDFARNIQDMMDGIGEWISEMPAIIEDILSRLPSVIQSLVASFPTIIKALVDAIPTIMKAVAEAMPQIISMLMDAMVMIVDKLPEMIGPLIDKLPEMIESVLRKLPDLILSIMSSLGEIIGQLAEALPGIIIAILDNLPQIIIALVEGICGAMGTIIESLIDAFIVKGGALKIAMALIQAVPRIAWALVSGIFNGMNAMYGAIGTALFKAFSAAFSAGSAALGKLFGGSLSSSIKMPKFSWPKMPSFSWPKLSTPSWIKTFSDAVSKLGNIGGGGKSFLGIKLAKGGIVPQYLAAGGFAARGTDTVPAMLTPGELVVPRDTVGALQSFLARESGSGSGASSSSRPQNVTVNLRVGEKELASVLLNLNRQGFRVA